ncbi:MAG: nucleotidyltransferase domain-containing protein, partial [Methanosarcinaceae archaeon]
MDMNKLEKSILASIKPSASELEHMGTVASELIDMINTIASRNNIPLLSTQLVGSAARGTWISGTHDLDIFMKFNEETDRQDLETYGLSLGREIAKDAE